MSPDDFEFVYADGKQVVYIYDGEEFYIYDVVAAEVYDIYHPDYADKFWHGWTDTLKVSICGEKYLVLLNMEGTDGQKLLCGYGFLWKYDYGGNEMRFGNSNGKRKHCSKKW
mgnify:CR=1 FL=1